MLDSDSISDRGYSTQRLLAVSGFYKSRFFWPMLGLFRVDGDPDLYLFAGIRFGLVESLHVLGRYEEAAICWRQCLQQSLNGRFADKARTMLKAAEQAR